MALSRALMMLILSGLGLQAFGQEAYRVLFAGGRTYLSQENSYRQLVSGQRLEDEAQLELVGNSMVLLMDDEGRMTRLSLSGKYDLSSLAKSVVSDSSAFIKSIWDQYYEQTDGPLSVQEQLLRDGATASGFELSIPSSSQLFGHRQVLQWSDKSTAYELHLINEFEEIFRKVSLTKNRVELDLLGKEFVWKPQFSLRVVSADGRYQSPLYTLEKLSPPDYERMDRLLKKYLAGDSFEMKLTRAAFFENQWLFADAQTLIMDMKDDHGELMNGFWKAYLLRNGFYSISNR